MRDTEKAVMKIKITKNALIPIISHNIKINLIYLCNHIFRRPLKLIFRSVKKYYLSFSKEVFVGSDLIISEKSRGIRRTLEVTNSGTLYDFKNVP